MCTPLAPTSPRLIHNPATLYISNECLQHLMFPTFKKNVWFDPKISFIEVSKLLLKQNVFKHDGYDLILAVIFTLMAHFDPMI